MTARIAPLLLFCLLLLAPTGAARSDADADAFRAVIAAQVEAFRRDDWPAAFGYASPGIRAQAGGVESFRRMVLGAYQAVARPRVFEFEPATVLDGRPVQPAFVVGPDGIAHRALYFMQQQPDGSWRIDGCTLLPVADRTT
jgi:ketosteroid isomerase-like protein